MPFGLTEAKNRIKRTKSRFLLFSCGCPGNIAEPKHAKVEARNSNIRIHRAKGYHEYLVGKAPQSCTPSKLALLDELEPQPELEK